ncbi:MAG: hypothetical protein BroJett011_04390 [Chloroflexota bacterium]|nr:MAG: hypothetical protein BroJett011_04390 [Chloroflexota bacterium]
MTTVEALEIAIALLREKTQMDRQAARINETRPELARHVDSHAVSRYQRHMQAIALLSDLKQREKEVQP